MSLHVLVNTIFVKLYVLIWLVLSTAFRPDQGKPEIIGLINYGNGSSERAINRNGNINSSMTQITFLGDVKSVR